MIDTQPASVEMSEVLTMLEPESDYKVRIAAKNIFGTGPSAEVDVTTTARIDSKLLIHKITQ